MRKMVKRTLLILLGLVATGFAVLGVFVPGLPTTIFLIIAVWAFASSNDRLHAWLLRAPIFKKAMVHVHKFQQEGSVPLHIKYIATGFAWGSLVLVAFTTPPEAVMAKAAVAAAALICTCVMLYLPTSAH